MLTAERLLSGKLWASPLAYKQNMFLSGTGSPWSLLLLLLPLSRSPSLLVCVFFFFSCDVIFSLSSHSLLFPEAVSGMNASLFLSLPCFPKVHRWLWMSSSFTLCLTFLGFNEKSRSRLGHPHFISSFHFDDVQIQYQSWSSLLETLLPLWAIMLLFLFPLETPLHWHCTVQNHSTECTVGMGTP